MISIETIRECAKCNRIAQKKVFEIYGGMLFKIAWRYVQHTTEAEDVVVKAFTKAFAACGRTTFIGVANFEAWLRRIAVNEALMVLRKKRKLPTDPIELQHERLMIDADVIPALSAEEILQLIQDLPAGYRTVFNLFAIDGYSHKEIAEMLNITEGASKSQFHKARMALQHKLKLLDIYG